MRTVEGFGQPCEYVFAEDQPWPWPKTKRLSFVDETQDLASIYEEDLLLNEKRGLSRSTLIPSRSSTRQPPTPGIATIPRSDSGTPATPYTPRNGQPSPTKRRRLNHESSSSGEYQHDDETPTLESAEQGVTPSSSRQSISRSPYVRRFESDALELEFSSMNSPHGEPPADHQAVVAPQIYIDNPQWPLRDLEQANLMRYYIENIAPFLDLCDLKRHFALVVPYRAASCPPLLNAIFAASARHLSRVAGADAWVADNYHSECLKSLIPLLNDSTALTDENLLAAMIILRYHEEIECKTQYELVLC